MEIQEVTQTHARTLLIRHKTDSHVNQMAVTLPYWNETMRSQIVGCVKVGRVTKEEMQAIEKALWLNDTRKVVH